MLVEFRWEDLKTGEIRRRERVQVTDRFVKFQLWDVLPSDQVRIFILDSESHGAVICEILLER